MINKEEMFRTVRLLGQLYVEMGQNTTIYDGKTAAFAEYNALQTALEHDIMNLGEASVNITGFDIEDGKFLVINEVGTSQHHSGLMATAECIRHERSSLVVEAIDVMIKEEDE